MEMVNRRMNKKQGPKSKNPEMVEEGEQEEAGYAQM